MFLEIKNRVNTNENIKIKHEAFYSNRHFKYRDFKYPKSNNKLKQFSKSNPVDKNRKISRCVTCDSKLNWANKYPHNRSQKYL